MRRLALAIALSGSAAFVGHVPAAAGPPTETAIQVVFTDINACTGEPDVYTVDLVFHTHDDHANGFVEPARRTGSSASGFVMQAGNGHFVENDNIVKVGLSDQWVHPDTGERMHARFVFVFNKNRGTVQVDSFVTLRCLGDEKFISTPGG